MLEITELTKQTKGNWRCKRHITPFTFSIMNTLRISNSVGSPLHYRADIHRHSVYTTLRLWIQASNVMRYTMNYKSQRFLKSWAPPNTKFSPHNFFLLWHAVVPSTFIGRSSSVWWMSCFVKDIVTNFNVQQVQKKRVCTSKTIRMLL